MEQQRQLKNHNSQPILTSFTLTNKTKFWLWMLIIQQDLAHRHHNLDKAVESVEAFMTVSDTGTELGAKWPDYGQKPRLQRVRHTPRGLP